MCERAPGIQIRQPECKRRDAAGEIAVLHTLETGRRDHRLELLLLGEPPDALDEIAVARLVAGHELAEPRDRLKGPRIVKVIEEGHLHLREFQTQKPAARLQHAEGFFQRHVDVGDVSYAEGDRVGILRSVRKRQRLGVPLDEGHTLAFRQLRQPPPAGLQHLTRDVADDRAGIGPRRPHDAERDIAGATRHIEVMPGRGRARWHQPVDEVVLPEPMQPARHDVVHHVVAIGDAGEDLIDEALALVLGNRLETEIGGAAAVLMGGGHGGRRVE